MAEEIHLGDVGTILEIEVQDGGVALDVSTATEMTLILQKPDLTTIERTLENSSDGTDGLVRYTTAEGDLDQSGKWMLQARIEFLTGTWSSSIAKFTVYANL